MTDSVIRGQAFVLADNIDTDQIIPAQYLNLVPTIPEEYEKLGSYALAGLPIGHEPFVPEGQTKTPYPIIVAGRNFGCGSSREHAPVSLGAAGAHVVVAQSYARIFYRNCIATGEIYPVETDERLCEKIKTGTEIEVDLENQTVTVLDSRAQYPTKPLGDAMPVIRHGGLFQYARGTGMIPQKQGA
ncbi:MAG: 3-isopropylmalate dehydratase [Verrucomicrobiota bacterium]